MEKQIENQEPDGRILCGLCDSVKSSLAVSLCATNFNIINLDNKHKGKMASSGWQNFGV